MTRPVGRPSQTKVKRLYEDFSYQAQSRDKERRVIAKIEWRPGELFPKVGFIVTNLPIEPEWDVRFYNQRGIAEQHLLAHASIRSQAMHQGRQACLPLDTAVVQAVPRQRSAAVTARPCLQPGNVASRCIELPEAMANWSLTSPQLKLIKMGARVVRHSRAITDPHAEVAVTGAMIRVILAAIHRLRAPPSCPRRRQLPCCKRNWQDKCVRSAKNMAERPTRSEVPARSALIRAFWWSLMPHRGQNT